jgi:hypothetical protein
MTQMKTMDAATSSRDQREFDRMFNTARIKVLG